MSPAVIEEAHEALRRRARDEADRLAVVSVAETRRLSFRDLGSQVTAWRMQLERVVGPRAGGSGATPLGFAVPNRSDFLSLVYALFELEIPVVLLDATRGLADLRGLCRTLGLPTLLHARALPSVSPGPDLLADPLRQDAPSSTCLGGDLWLDHLDDVEPASMPSGTALVKLTSGSTGTPRGACFDAASLAVGIAQIGAGMEIDARDRVLLAIPLSHSYGFDSGALSLAALGTPLVLHRGLQSRGLLARELVATACREGATVLPLVPPLVRALGAVDWSSAGASTPHRLRRVLCAGGALGAEAADAFFRAAGVPVHQFYGSSETGGITFERAPLESGARGTVGFPLPGVELRLEPADRPQREPGAEAARSRGPGVDRAPSAGGEPGRVTVVSAANRIGALGESAGPQDRPVVPGDLGILTPCGRLRLVGRSAAVLNVGGRKIAVSQVEAALCGLDGVGAAAVFGVADPVRGDRVVAFLVADRWPVDLSPLPQPWRPRKIVRLEQLPHTVRGKVDRAALRRRLDEGVEPT